MIARNPPAGSMMRNLTYLQGRRFVAGSSSIKRFERMLPHLILSELKTLKAQAVQSYNQCTGIQQNRWLKIIVLLDVAYYRLAGLLNHIASMPVQKIAAIARGAA